MSLYKRIANKFNQKKPQEISQAPLSPTVYPPPFSMASYAPVHNRETLMINQVFI